MVPSLDNASMTSRIARKRAGKQPIVGPINDTGSHHSKRARKSPSCLLEILGTSEFTISFQPALLHPGLQDASWQNHDTPISDGSSNGADIGIVLRMPSSPTQEMSASYLAEQIGPLLTNMSTTALRTAVYDLICLGADTVEQVLDSMDTHHNNTSSKNKVTAFGQADLQCWSLTPAESLASRRRAFLQRLFRPVVLLSADTARKSRFSFMEALLEVPEVQEYVLDALVIQIGATSYIPSFHQFLVDSVCNLFQAGTILDSPAFQDIVDFVCSNDPNLENALVAMTPRNVTSRQEMVKFKAKARSWKHYLSMLAAPSSSKCRIKISAKVKTNRSSLPKDVAFGADVAKERQRLVQEFRKGKHQSQSSFDTENMGNKEQQQQQQQRASGRKITPKGRERDGSLRLRESEISLQEFVAKTKLMNTANQAFPRKFYAKKSRPRMQGVNLTPQELQAMNSVVFDDDGSLRNSIVSDIDTSSKHGYINFANLICPKQRWDYRWQVPIRKHGIGSKVETRTKVEEILSSVYNPGDESIYDLGILIGGTEDQSLHHDVARQVVAWQSETASEASSYISGWEIERLAYNEAMASPNAPSSVLIGMGDKKEVLLGVQKDQVVPLDDDETKCRIHGGSDDVFDIVRENEFLVVVRAKTGAMFTGDFPHAGVRNVARGTELDEMLSDLIRQISAVLQRYNDNDQIASTKAVIGILCNFKGLNKLCRLHFSTEISSGSLNIPANTIGFSGCLPNPPDPRCLGNETDTPNKTLETEIETTIVSSEEFSEDADPMEIDSDDSDDESFCAEEDHSAPLIYSGSASDRVKRGRDASRKAPNKGEGGEVNLISS